MITVSQQRTIGLPKSQSRQPSLLEGSRLWASKFLTWEDRRALSGAVHSSRHVEAGCDVFREGERTDTLHLITAGWACRYTITREGGRQLPVLLLPGDIGNLDSLLFDCPGYGFRALTRVTTVALSCERLRALSAQHAGIARTFIWLAFIENAALSKLAQSLGRYSAKQRLAHLLCELSVRLCDDKNGADCFDLPLTQEQIADMLGLTPVHVNRTMQQIRADKLIRTAHRMITILDMPALRRLAGFDPYYLHLEQGKPRTEIADSAVPGPPSEERSGTLTRQPR